MAQRTGRKVPASVPSLPEMSATAGLGSPKKQDKMSMGSKDSTDMSAGNDGSKAPAAKPSNSHKGPQDK